MLSGSRGPTANAASGATTTEELGSKSFDFPPKCVFGWVVTTVGVCTYKTQMFIESPPCLRELSSDTWKMARIRQISCMRLMVEEEMSRAFLCTLSTSCLCNCPNKRRRETVMAPSFASRFPRLLLTRCKKGLYSLLRFSDSTFFPFLRQEGKEIMSCSASFCRRLQETKW